MASYLVKRVLMALLALLIITCVTFIIMNLVPGGPFMSEKAPSPEVLAALEAKYGLNKPIGEQLINYLKDVLRGDFGVSFRMQKNRPVIEIIQDLFPVSARVGLFAVINAVLIGIPIGCLAAYNRGKVLDSALRVVMTIGISIPSFVVATLLLILLSVNLKILPGMGLTDWRNYIMPCFALSFYPMCYIGRMTRSSMLDAINADYIRTARAKGLSSGRIIFKHALRNSLIPVVTYIGPMIAYLLTGGFVVETVFSIPGLGRYFIQSILNRDYPIIMGTTVFLAAFVIMMNLVVDILYKVIDPRINLSNGGEA
ncbi:MAG: ABC transporter permease [Eubacteriales bacterium]|nr:ABC transporter permease [Eubacteriales bacterium]MCI7570531.1 ABC transporter permease [Clostridiales bacterium]MDD7551007.1 ABC transporter permease [Clostridia bacterium]MDY5754648.1 ABC transporter permease [Eubacteriales bacterium]